MKKIVKALAALGAAVSVGIVASRGRDRLSDPSSRPAGDYTGERCGTFGDSPAYQLARNQNGDVIFTDPNRALRQFREEHPASFQPLREKYSLPALRMDTCGLYAAYLEYDPQYAHPLLSAFLQTFLHSFPRS